jgi:hypothetical protein
MPELQSYFRQPDAIPEFPGRPIVSVGKVRQHFQLRNGVFAPFVTNVKAIILPRQARDKHRTNSRTSGVFLSGWVGAAVSRTRIHDAFYASKNRYPFFRHFNLGAILDLCLPSHYRRMYLVYMVHMEEAGRFSFSLLF